MRAVLLRGAHDFLGGQANALIVDVHAAVARPEGDLFGAVGMAVEPRLADQEAAAACPSRSLTASTASRMSSSPSVLLETGLDDARRAAVFAIDRRASASAHSPVVTPALAAAIDGSMMLRPSLGRGAQIGQRRFDRGCVALRAFQAFSRSIWSAPSPGRRP